MACTRRSKDSEAVFRVLRRLVQVRCVWGEGATFRVSDLIASARANRLQVLRALIWLKREGLVSVERPARMVRLTPLAVADLSGTPQPI